MDALRKSYVALILYFVLAIVLTYPMCIAMSDSLIGHPQATVGCHLWVLWWAQQGITEIETPLLFFPNGGDVAQLYGSDLLSPLLLSWVPISPVFLYNVWVFALIVCGAMGVRNLSLYLKSDFGGAFSTE